MRVTKKYITDWVNAELKRLGIDATVREIYNPRLRRDEVEGGAARLIISLNTDNNFKQTTIYSFHLLKDFEYEINNKNCELKLKLKHIGGGMYSYHESELTTVSKSS